MLSALIQSEAAIVAIVVTLSLVVVQLAAQSYSVRVIEVFRRRPDFWILIGIYGIAIFYGLGVLKLIDKADPALNGLSNLEGEVAFSYYFGVFAYAALVPYMWKMFDMVKPSNLVDIISEKITKRNILAAIWEGDEQSYENDPIQPIIDIIRSSLMKYDPETVRYGLRALGDVVEYMFKNETFGKDEDEIISKHVFSQIARIGKLAASKGDEDSTMEVISNLYKCGIAATDRKFEGVAKQVAISLREIGEESAKQELADAAFMVATSLREVGETTVKLRLTHAASQAAESLEKLQIASKEHGLEEVSQIAGISLDEMNKALEKLPKK
jgi:hypothetical protein